MAQAGFSRILIYKSDTATSIPVAGNLTNSATGAELAVNTADLRLFTKNSGGSVVELGTNPSSLTLPNGTANGVLYLNGSKVATSGSALTFDGTNLTVANGDITIGTNGKKLYTNYIATNSGVNLNFDSANFLFNTGNVGINTTPSGYLANKVVISTGTDSNNGITIASATNKNGSIWFADGTTGDQAYRGGVDYQHTTDTLYLYSGGQGNLQLNSSGNLGLGVTPSAWSSAFGPVIQVKTGSGGGALTGSSTDNFRMFANTFYDGSYKRIGAGYATQYEQASGAHAWYTAGTSTASSAITFTQAMTLDASGNLGIGTASPAGKLDIRSASGSGNTVLMRGGTYTDILYSTGIRFLQPASTLNANRQFRFTSGDNSLTLQGTDGAGTDAADTNLILQPSGGSVGIGTSSPSNRLTVSGANTAARGQLSVVGASASPRITLYEDSTFYAAFAASGTDAYIGTESNTPFRFITNGSERARITAGGYFKASNAGTYVSSTSTYHELYSNASSDWIGYFTQATATSPNGVVIQYTAAAPNGTANTFIYCQDNAAVRATIRSNGGLANYQANDVNLSDQRVKKDIKPLGSMWNKFKALEIVTFKYKDQTHDDDNIGVIAQQVESVAPEFIDTDGFGKTPEGEEPLKTVYTTDMYHAAIKALQEAMARIEQLEAKVAVLENK